MINLWQAAKLSLIPEELLHTAATELLEMDYLYILQAAARKGLINVTQSQCEPTCPC